MDWDWSGKGEHDHSIDAQKRGMSAFSDYIRYTFHMSYLEAMF